MFGRRVRRPYGHPPLNALPNDVAERNTYRMRRLVPKQVYAA